MLRVIADSCEFVIRACICLSGEKTLPWVLSYLHTVGQSKHQGLYSSYLLSGYVCAGHEALQSQEKMGEGVEVLSINIENCLWVSRKINQSMLRTWICLNKCSYCMALRLLMITVYWCLHSLVSLLQGSWISITFFCLLSAARGGAGFLWLSSWKKKLGSDCFVPLRHWLLWGQ